MNDPIAWCAWNQGFFPSVRKAMVAAAVFLTHPDNPQRSGPHGTTRLFIIRHDTRKGWRLVNCADRGPAPHEMALGFYGPITPRNITAHLNTHKAAMPAREDA
jgi:hypothetical protein